jgi:single-stranded DNA-binding protein
MAGRESAVAGELPRPRLQAGEQGDNPMNNRVTLTGKLLDDPKVRTLEFRGGSSDIVSLWLEVGSGERRDRFTVEIHCPAQQEAAKAMRKGVLAEVTGVLRHDRWKHKETGKWVGKVFVAIDPAQGKIKSLGMADSAADAA